MTPYNLLQDILSSLQLKCYFNLIIVLEYVKIGILLNCSMNSHEINNNIIIIFLHKCSLGVDGQGVIKDYVAEIIGILMLLNVYNNNNNNCSVFNILQFYYLIPFIKTETHFTSH